MSCVGFTRLTLFLVLCLIPKISTNDCSSQNLNSNQQQCLNSIWNKAKNKDSFWFGTNWLSICGPNPFGPPYCSNLQQPYQPHSLLNTIYGLGGDFTQNPLEQYLNITYTAMPGSYRSCSNRYTVDETLTFTLEPLLSNNYQPFQTRSRPVITWIPKPQTYYTLFIYDAGAYYSHGVFVNILETDIESSDMVRTYHGPMNPSTREQPYAFLLFEQTYRLTLSSEMRTKLSKREVRDYYNFTDVFQELQLKGPIAMNWIQVTRDPYSVQYFVDFRVINDCPAFVTEELKKKQISFIPDDVDLSMTLDISIETPALTFNSCCTTYTYSKQSHKLNPIGDGYISPGRARSEGKLYINLLQRGYLFMPMQLGTYTLLAVDISVPNPSAGTPDLPLLHMLQININGSDFTSGDFIQSYGGPAPPDNLNHTYLFLLYQQSGTLNATVTEGYLNQGCRRCLFNVTRFVTGSSLTLLGASWFLATHDEYVRYMYLNRGDDPDSVCANVPGYTNPCPSPSEPINECSSQNLNNYQQQCLDSIWNKAKNKDSFWFGTNWLSICGPNPFGPPYCSNLQQPYQPHSLLNTIYGLDGDFTNNPLEQYLKITYTATPGSYSSCSNRYTVDETLTFDLEPLQSKNYHPFQTRFRPVITWIPKPQTYYTLIIYDAGAYYSHGVFVNILETDIESSDMVRTYHGPMNPSTREQPYAFLLFEQNDRLNLSSEMRTKLSKREVMDYYNFTDVFQELQLQGPIAMNWMQVTRDPYSVQYFVDNTVINDCPAFVTEELKKKQISFIPDDVDLSMTLDISIETTVLTFNSCCTSYTYAQQSHKMNPIGDGYISPGRARSEGKLHISLLQRGYLFMPIQLGTYTLLAVDISVPNPSAGTPDLPLLHMLQININGSDFTSGDFIQSYGGPAPPDNMNHTYLFLLYQQSGTLNTTVTESYLNQGCRRCLFNVTRFVTGSSLTHVTLVGASWFLATHDEYVRYTYLNGGRDSDTVCANVTGYTNPCPATLEQINECSPQNLNNYQHQCLASIWNKAKNKDTFWFGTNWASICGPMPIRDCSSLQQPYQPHSLLNTIYGLHGDFTQNPLEQYLDIKYTAMKGSYNSCRNRYTVSQTSTFNLEPLLSKNYHPFQAKTSPVITWIPKPQTYYTLFIYDAGAYYSHGVFINILETDIDSSDMVRTYHGPMNPSTKEQPYAFLLFEQTEKLNISSEMRTNLSKREVRDYYNFTDVFRELRLKGPIAMNWIQVTRDPYSVQYFLDYGVMNECPELVTEELKGKQISFIPDDLDLTMTLDITIETPKITFQSCCRSYTYAQQSNTLNPIGNGYISPGRARTEGTLKISLIQRGFLFMPFPLATYTLVCVDISVPNPTSGTPDRPRLHMLYININGSDFTSGDVIESYGGPAPPDNLNHTYLFLLYQQNGMLNTTVTEGYLTEGCRRCLFNVSRFVSGSSLTLVGASWLLATHDEYVRYMHVNWGRDPETVCANVPGYGNPCPTSFANTIYSSTASSIVLVVLQMIIYSQV